MGGGFPAEIVDECDDLVYRCGLPSRVWLLRYLIARALRDDRIMAELHELDLMEDAAEFCRVGVGRWTSAEQAKRLEEESIRRAGGGDQELVEVTAERDRLRQRVMDLEGVVRLELAAAASLNDATRHLIEALGLRVELSPESDR